VVQINEKIGMTIEPYIFGVEKGKFRELALAIGDEKEEYLSGELAPPTFPTIIEFQGSVFSFSDFLNVRDDQLLHGEQEYHYFSKFKHGDSITVTGIVENAYKKKSKNFFVIKREFRNQYNEIIAVSRTTIIELIQEELK